MAFFQANIRIPSQKEKDQLKLIGETPLVYRGPSSAKNRSLSLHVLPLVPPEKRGGIFDGLLPLPANPDSSPLGCQGHDPEVGEVREGEEVALAVPRLGGGASLSVLGPDRSKCPRNVSIPWRRSGDPGCSSPP